MDLADEAAAQRLHAARVTRALARGARDGHDELPDPPHRGLVVGLLLSVVIVVLVGVGSMLVTALSSGEGLRMGYSPAVSGPTRP